MLRSAIEKSNRAYRRAADALASLQAAQSPQQAQDAWDDFVVQYVRTIKLLHSGAQRRPKSKIWAARLVRDRRKDQLLKYVYQSRNATEHNVSSEPTDLGPTSINVRGGVVVEHIHIDSEGRLRVESVQPEDPNSWLEIGVQLILVGFDDEKHKDHYDIPTEHLGRPFPHGRSPLKVAQAAFDYLSEVMKEARSMRS